MEQRSASGISAGEWVTLDTEMLFPHCCLLQLWLPFWRISVILVLCVFYRNVVQHSQSQPCHPCRWILYHDTWSRLLYGLLSSISDWSVHICANLNLLNRAIQHRLHEGATFCLFVQCIKEVPVMTSNTIIIISGWWSRRWVKRFEVFPPLASTDFLQVLQTGRPPCHVKACLIHLLPIQNRSKRCSSYLASSLNLARDIRPSWNLHVAYARLWAETDHVVIIPWLLYRDPRLSR